MRVSDVRRKLREKKFSGRKAVLAFLSLFEATDYAYRVFGGKWVTFCVVGDNLDGQITVERGKASKLSIQPRKAAK